MRTRNTNVLQMINYYFAHDITCKMSQICNNKSIYTVTQTLIFNKSL